MPRVLRAPRRPSTLVQRVFSSHPRKRSHLFTVPSRRFDRSQISASWVYGFALSSPYFCVHALKSRCTVYVWCSVRVVLFFCMICWSGSCNVGGLSCCKRMSSCSLSTSPLLAKHLCSRTVYATCTRDLAVPLVLGRRTIPTASVSRLWQCSCARISPFEGATDQFSLPVIETTFVLIRSTLFVKNAFTKV